MEQHLDNLTKLFLKFPGIGSRQAKRFAYFILSQQESYVKNLASTLLEARARAHTCSLCFRIYEGDRGLCDICADEKRDETTLIVVEKSTDIDVFSKTDYRGKFFVLGGLIPIVQKHIVDGTNANKLIEKIQKQKEIEVILAFPLTPNGDHTDTVLRELLAPHTQKISSLGRGLSIGTELEYADPASLEASLKKRE